MKGAFNILNLPVLNAFLKLDPRGLPDRDSLSFESYSEEELKVLHDFYGAGKQDTFQGRMVQADALYDTQFSSLLLEFRYFKSYVTQQKISLSQEYAGKEKSLRSKFDLVNAHKYKTRKRFEGTRRGTFYIIAEKANDLLSVEDLLKDTVVETVFPNIRRLLKISILISSSEVVVERGFSKMGQMITKKTCFTGR